MKFTIEQNKLINLLKVPSIVIDSNTLNPILSGLLLECKNNVLTIISSNNDFSVKVSTNDANIQNEGKILIHGKMFYNIINKIKNSTITLEEIDSSILRISTPSFSSDLNLIDNVGYPAINFGFADRTKCAIDGGFLFKVISKLTTVTNISNDRISPLNGILFDTTRLEGFIEAVGTDGHHLAYLKAPYSGEKFKIVVGVNVLKIIQELITNKKEVNFYLKNNQLIIDFQNICFNCRLIDGDYPSAIKAIETKQQFHFTISKSEITGAIERGLVLASGDKKPSVLFNINPNLLKISCRSIEYGSSYEEVKIEGDTGSNVSVTFSVKYLSDLIKIIDNEEILFEFTESNKHFFIKDAKNINYLSLILPIRMI